MVSPSLPLGEKHAQAAVRGGSTVYQVIPSESARLAPTEGFRCGTFKLTSAGFRDYARDDPVIS